MIEMMLILVDRWHCLVLPTVLTKDIVVSIDPLVESCDVLLILTDDSDG